jgi:endonuclease/exonuclease/phosphatase family metal-dependent hydrolase
MDPQGTFLVDEVNAQPYLTILGGDFNTWRSASTASLERALKKVGLERLGADTGYTFSAYGWHPTLDHIFATEGLDNQAGVFRGTEASDHFPIWADIIIGDDE